MKYFLIFLFAFLPITSYATQLQLGHPRIIQINKIQDLKSSLERRQAVLDKDCLLISDYDMTLAWPIRGVQQGDQILRFFMIDPFLSISPNNWSSSHEEIIRGVELEKPLKSFEYRDYQSWVQQYLSQMNGLAHSYLLEPVEQIATVSAIRDIQKLGVKLHVVTRGNTVDVRAQFLKEYFFEDKTLDEIRKFHFDSANEKDIFITNLIREKKPKTVVVLDDNLGEVGRIFNLIQNEVQSDIPNEFVSKVYLVHYNFFHHQLGQESWIQLAINEFKQVLDLAKKNNLQNIQPNIKTQ